ncbi:hypothetical protein [Vagococcus zengguangii]|uniref:Uncharacterized protein n=1 Tax=Vagococcus zengguangii TaxID=2571750 RepID=A0A4D7CTN9_9ENTE|nr:hypothetical protein [Vagococcus zengguangii]QCI86593.1 hypothetical protein FA707_06245 [Vagococcus zengguangii]TLG79771.1 hypothetical protein FE258_07875 [Vagococcus zengguangii]
MSNKKTNSSFLLIGFIYGLIGLLGCWSYGFIGRLITNVFRFFVGEGYMILGIISIVYGLLLILLKKELHFKKPRVFWAFFSWLMAYVCWMQRGFIANDATTILSQIFKGLYQDVQLNQQNFDSGGGLLGASVHQLLSWLHLDFLMPFTMIVFVLIGLMLFIKKS